MKSADRSIRTSSRRMVGGERLVIEAHATRAVTRRALSAVLAYSPARDTGAVGVPGILERKPR